MWCLLIRVQICRVVRYCITKLAIAARVRRSGCRVETASRQCTLYTLANENQCDKRKLHEMHSTQVPDGSSAEFPLIGTGQKCIRCTDGSRNYRVPLMQILQKMWLRMQASVFTASVNIWNKNIKLTLIGAGPDTTDFKAFWRLRSCPTFIACCTCFFYL